jgi:hypothetical protein
MKPRPALAPLDERQRYSIPEGIAYLRSSRKSFYDDVKAGRIRLIKDGRRSYVHGSELIRRSALSRGAAALLPPPKHDSSPPWQASPKCRQRSSFGSISMKILPFARHTQHLSRASASHTTPANHHCSSCGYRASWGDLCDRCRWWARLRAVVLSRLRQ